MNRYKYQPLQYHDSIRILLLQPSSDASAPITCTIQHVRLSDPGLSWFEAISYTWGTIAEKTIYIQDEKAELRVRENCHSALQHLRRRDTIRPLWIDAVCIDQENLGERASQVRIMNEIYSGALTVVVYLGEQDEGSVALFEELEAADQLLQQLKKCERPPPSDALLREIDRLYQRPWFNRVWVLQEVCGKACVDIMCGSTTVSMEALVAFNFGYRRGYSVTKTDWPQVLEWNHRPPRDFSTPQFDLWNRLYHSRRCVATDPRDRVFALRSLMGSKRSELDSLIDYTKSLEQCFIDVAKFLLPVLGLRILVAVRHPHTKSMPSWIPDWSQSLPLQHNFFWTEADLFCADQAEPNYRPSYQPLDETKLTIRSFVGKDQKEGLELRVTGCRYAQIVARSQVFSFDSADEAEEQIKSLYSSLSNLRAFIGLDNMIIDNEISEKLGQDIIKAMSLIHGKQLHQGLVRTSTIIEGDDRGPIHKEQLQLLIESLQQSRISLMDNGEIAIGPSDTQCGDTVCILWGTESACGGTESACAVRPSQDGFWSLISGDVYIFTEEYKVDESPMWFMSDDFISDNYERAETFVIR